MDASISFSLQASHASTPIGRLRRPPSSSGGARSAQPSTRSAKATRLAPLRPAVCRSSRPFGKTNFWSKLPQARAMPRRACLRTCLSFRTHLDGGVDSVRERGEEGGGGARRLAQRHGQPPPRQHGHRSGTNPRLRVSLCTSKDPLESACVQWLTWYKAAHRGSANPARP